MKSLTMNRHSAEPPRSAQVKPARTAVYLPVTGSLSRLYLQPTKNSGPRSFYILSTQVLDFTFFTLRFSRQHHSTSQSLSRRVPRVRKKFPLAQCQLTFIA